MADQFIRGPAVADPLRATFKFRITLDEQAIGIRLWMNPRSFRWTCDILDSAGRPLIQGHALVSQADVFEPYRPLLPGVLPPGLLFVLDTQGGDPPKDFGAWRERWILKYRPVADIDPETLPRVA